MGDRDHVVVYDGSDGQHQGMQMECTRCGESYTPALPVPVSVWLGMAKAFTKDHAGCRERGEVTS